MGLILVLLSADSNNERPGHYNRGVLQQTSPEKLRKYVAILYENEGYTTEVSRNSAEYIDVVAKSDEELVAISVRRRQEEDRVSANAVKRFADSLQKFGADSAIMVSTSYFTKPARDTAKQSDIKLLNGDELAEHFTKCNDIPK
ncbi:Restriction endonuclease [Natronobacterium texcoconense]|uniref:Restriction endonuclease n=1 Tax=Natronobacterium texcoconense TaxID=1095778 RepID=A0A1H1G105_NATTX|nr:Restriction endonuclease [Natronobacterium texcoconense]